MVAKNSQTDLTLASQQLPIDNLLKSLATLTDQDAIEAKLYEDCEQLPDQIIPDSNHYYDMLNHQLYRYILKHYKHKEDNLCIWRYIKNLPLDQLDYQQRTTPVLKMLDHLIRVYFYSGPLDDLSCIFIPIDNQYLIKKYLDWIKSYFYNANYPTSLLWLYALDSSVEGLLPDEIIYLGRRQEQNAPDIILPDFSDNDTVLFKRFSDKPNHYIMLQGDSANYEFTKIFNFLQKEYKDRCLSRSIRYDDETEPNHLEGWEKFEDVLRFGVSDKGENGCVSFSDMRASTEFLNTYGKNTYLNKIQQPFFAQTKLISRRYKGRIDKFMGDNVMCVFLSQNMPGKERADREMATILNNLFSLFSLCRILYTILTEQGFGDSNLGLRSGITYGSQILRSNLGNEIVRDFTVTGETVNLSARLEHISVQELKIHSKAYFEQSIERFPKIRDLMSLKESLKNLNPETTRIIREFTLYQNILSNLGRLEDVKFDIRFNQTFYRKLRAHLLNRGYHLLNKDVADIYGYEEFEIEGFTLKFYFSYYNPKGFSSFEKMWILPLEIELLQGLDIEKIE